MSKYHARKQVYDGLVFDSAAELTRWQELCLLERGGVISGLRRADSYLLIPAFTRDGVKYRKVEYTPDFTYTENGKQIIEELKSKATKRARDYAIRVKLFLRTYPDIVFREVMA